MRKTRLQPERTLLGYFHDAVHQASRNQRLDASDGTLHYLSGLLSDYAHADRLFDHTRDGRRIQPLAVLYGQALQTPSVRERSLLLQRLGDVALFIGGLFGGRLQRRLVDLDYCVRMGAAAYGYLADSRASALGSTRQTVFAELAAGFGRFVGVLAEIGAQRPGASRDPLDLYALWEQCRDPRLAERLSALGLAPVATPSRRHH